jgi:hypothetical protein
MESRISGHWRADLGIENFVVSVGFVRSHKVDAPQYTRDFREQRLAGAPGDRASRGRCWFWSPLRARNRG